jgi:DNA-binding transcriptional ArsR family regulator
MRTQRKVSALPCALWIQLTKAAGLYSIYRSQCLCPSVQRHQARLAHARGDGLLDGKSPSRQELDGAFTCKYLLVYHRMTETNDKVFKALADPSRRLLFDRLFASNGQTLTELCEHLDMTRQAVTQHLNVLEAANLVTTVWRGRAKLHYFNPVPLQEIYERWIRKFERPRLSALHKIKQRLERDDDE